jgi:hypothetical protein
VPAQPDIAEVPWPCPADAIEPDLDHGDVHRAGRRAGGKERELLLFALRIEDPDGLSPASLGRAVEFAEIADRVLAGPVRGAHGFDEGPVDVVLPVLAAPIRSNKHRASTPRSHTRRGTAKREGLHYIPPRAPVLSHDGYFHTKTARVRPPWLGVVRNLG